MITDQSFGIVPLREREGVTQFLLVRHKAGHWGFPKGHAEPGETPLETARRELREEAGLALASVVESPSFSESYEVIKRKTGKRVLKTVTYFLGVVDDGEVVQCPKEIVDAAWGDADQTRQRLTYAEARELFDRVRSHLSGHPVF